MKLFLTNSNNRLHYIPKFNKIVTIVLIICPIIQTYGWGKYDFAFLTTIFFSFFYIAFKHPRNYIPKWLGLYLLYCCFSSVLSMTSIISLIQFSIIRIFLAYLLFYDSVDSFFLKMWYKRIVYVCIAFFFLQEVCYYGMGIRISGIVEFLPLSVSDDATEYYEKVMGWKRSASFYSEPSYLAQAIFPLLCIELFDFSQNKKKRIFSVSILIIALLMLQSGTALLGLVSIFLYYSFFLVKKRKKNYSIIILIFSIMAATIIANIYFDSDMGQNVLNRQDQLTLDASSGQSGFIRIYRGYFVYGNYSVVEKISGLFNGEVIQDKIRTSVVAFTFAKGDMSFNVIQNILLRTGIIGMVLIVLFICSMWKKASPISQALIVVISVLSFIEALYFKEMMTMYLIMIYCFKECNKYE